MNAKWLKSGFGSAVFSALLATGVVAIVSTTAEAQYRNDGYYGGYRNDIYRIAAAQGYRDGVEHGAEHARDNDRYNPQGTRHYKDADSGYQHDYGDKDSYKRAYRQGYLRGYDVGYRQNGYNGRTRNYDPYYPNDDRDYGRDEDYGGYRRDREYGNPGYSGRDNVYQIAEEQGYRDGVDHGAEHAQEGHRFDPEGTRHYKDADSGYQHDYGNKESYKRAYREGFRRGYQQGYGQYGGRRPGNSGYRNW